MPVFEYKAFDLNGKPNNGIIDADSARSARLNLRNKGLFPTELIESVKLAEGKKEVSFSTLLKRIKHEDIILFTRQLSTLVGASIPVVDSLTAIIEQIDNELLQKVVTQVRDRVREGSSLGDAFAEHPRIFFTLFVNMVRAGEASGALSLVLNRLADLTEKQQVLKNKVWSTLTYPLVMVVFGGGVLLFLMAYVIPIVSGIFSETQKALPLPTVILISTSNLVRNWWWLFTGIFSLIYLTAKRYIKTSKGRMHFDQIKLKLPLFGPLIKKLALSRFARTMGILLNSGVTVVNAFDIVKTVVDNKVIYRILENARENIKEGEDIAPPLERNKIFPSLVIHMIAVGEKTGNLEEMFNRIADAYEMEIQTNIERLTSLLEPIMIISMGIAVGFIVLSILLPIFEMNNIIR